MIDSEEKLRIRNLHEIDRLSVNEICALTRRHHSTVGRALSRSRDQCAQPKVGKQGYLEVYREFIEQKLIEYPDLKCTRLAQLLADRGLERVALSTLRRFVKSIRVSKPRKAYIKVKVFPGEQAQVDWGAFGKINEGRAVRKLSLFVMILSYSRYLFARFYTSEKTPSLLLAHSRAFSEFGGTPAMILYDNMRTAVKARQGGAVAYTDSLINFAADYGFKPLACNPYSGWEKGRVEKSIRYVRENFFPDRVYSSLSDLNSQLDSWLSDVANQRPWADDKSRQVIDVFKSEEKPTLRLVKQEGEQYAERLMVEAKKYPFVRFDLNNYSIPPRFVGQPVELLANEEQVRIVSGSEQLALHQRSYSRGEDIEDKAHLEELLKQKNKALFESRKRWFFILLPQAESYIAKLAGGELSSTHIHRRLQKFFVEYGKAALGEALNAQLAMDSVSLCDLEFILTQSNSKRAAGPEIDLSSRPELSDLHVEPSQLSDYQCLDKKEEEI